MSESLADVVHEAVERAKADEVSGIVVTCERCDYRREYEGDTIPAFQHEHGDLLINDGLRVNASVDVAAILCGG